MKLSNFLSEGNESMTVGTMVKLKVPMLGNEVGTVGVGFNDYGSGCQFIFKNGEYDGFSKDEQVKFLKKIGDSGLDYNFKNVIQVSRDFDDGYFDNAFSLATRLDNYNPMNVVDKYIKANHIESVDEILQEAIINEDMNQWLSTIANQLKILVAKGQQGIKQAVDWIKQKVWPQVGGQGQAGQTQYAQPLTNVIRQNVPQNSFQYFMNSLKATPNPVPVTESVDEINESDPSLRPPKKWWKKHYAEVKSGNPDYNDEKVRATVGAIWYKKMSKKQRVKSRHKEGKHYGKAE